MKKPTTWAPDSSLLSSDEPSNELCPYGVENLAGLNESGVKAASYQANVIISAMLANETPGKP